MISQFYRVAVHLVAIACLGLIVHRLCIHLLQNKSDHVLVLW